MIANAALASSGQDSNRSWSWILPLSVVFGIVFPLAGTFILDSAYPNWKSDFIMLHSSIEVGGAALGIVLSVIILYSRQADQTYRNLWIALALLSMAVLDICHSAVPIGNRFVWLHSLAGLIGGVFFVLVWFPDGKVSRKGALVSAAAAFLAMALIGILSAIYKDSVPRMIDSGEFTSLAGIINIIGGALTLLASLSFAIQYHRFRQAQDLLFMLLCQLFGITGVLFPLSVPWGAGWWFWHVVRFGAYMFAFGQAMLSYRQSEQEMLRAHNELDGLFHAAVDGKCVIDTGYNLLRANDTFAQISGIPRDMSEGMTCSDVMKISICDTDDCPLKRFESGNEQTFEKEVICRRKDGSSISCVLKAVRLKGVDGSFRGVIESFLDITDRKEAEDLLKEQSRQKTGQAELADKMRGDLSTEEICRNIITYLCKYLDAQTGVMYVADSQGMLRLMASYAYKHRKHMANEYKPGEGLIGQAALEKQDIVLTNVPEDYIAVESGLGESIPKNIYIKPVIHNDEVVAVIELATLREFDKNSSQFLDIVVENIAVSMDSAKSRTRLAKSLEESQQLSEELQVQQEELRTTNEELEDQAKRLRESEERLKAQQEELQVTNEELEEKNDMLERQKQEIEIARKGVEDKAEELALASKYKSEFLANMSHELRTPLNSLLLLAQGLAQNKAGNLNSEQVESAKIIHGSGSDLLNLINEILDLSKIEAGRMTVESQTMSLKDLAESVESSFGHMAEDKGVELNIEFSENVPDKINSDYKRVQQIIRNLVSNAIKFTSQGEVRVAFSRVNGNVTFGREDLDPKKAISIAVSDTGIGIEEKHRKLIFEAFQQADGSTSRKYGGTGLGLSISRELARILGGEIQLESAAGKGSTFTLYLPAESSGEDSGNASKVTYEKQQSDPGQGMASAGASVAVVADDRTQLSDEDNTVLVIEDDPNFAKILQQQCHQKKMKCLVASTGEEGLKLASQYIPGAVILDIKLPGMDGWAVLAALKEDTSTRHIPVHVVSGEDTSGEALRKGAIGQETKPLDQSTLDKVFEKLEHASDGNPKRVLVVEDDLSTLRETSRLISDSNITVDQARDAESALKSLRENKYDCVVLDLELPDQNARQVLKTLCSEGVDLPPVIIYTASDLTREEEEDLREYAESIVIKDVRSQERLLDEVALFLHRVVNRMPEKKRKIIRDLHDTDEHFRGKRVLVVDDDMRTTFAVSRLLSERGMTPVKAENGEKAVTILEQDQKIDIVLMDIMMPVMDGFEAIRKIRENAKFAELPIIALTAKAMPEDKDKCMAAGASDYLPKPVDPERLLSMMRVWLYR